MPATPEEAGSGGGVVSPAVGRDVLFSPMARFYAKAGISLPEIEFVDGEAMPEPARSLLVHDGDMTSRLRRFHGVEIGLRCVSVAREGDDLLRLVVLTRADNGSPVEFGAIRIDLGALDGEVRARVEAGNEPLGGILEGCKINYVSGPRAFFRYGVDAFIGIVLDEEVEKPLYGRCNTLTLSGSARPFAEIVEILPEAE